MSVTLRKKENANGTTSLYLDIYHNGKRHKEFLKECKLTKSSNPADRQANREKLALAKKIQTKRAQELESNNYDVIPAHKSKVDFITYFEHYIEGYTKRDKRNMQGACNKFKDFMKSRGINAITLQQLNENIIHQYAEYLKDNCNGEGASSYFARFKKMLRQAVREKIILRNPATDITIKREEGIKKDVLNIEELKRLIATPNSNREVRSAFIFSCFTGMRWADVVELKWKHIDLEQQRLSKLQSKTDIKLNVLLHDTAIAALPSPGKPDELIFKLPSHTGALKNLRNWVNKAELNKHITWHCARHSFATNLILHETDIYSVSNLMGHNSIKYTGRYVRIAEEMKRKAIDNLPKLDV
ncbi:MAG TPA: site-specific integrase [Roseivirga sp.]